MRRLGVLALASFTLGCEDGVYNGVGGGVREALEMELRVPCTTDCLPGQLYTGSVEVTLPAGHEAVDVACRAQSTSLDIELGSASGQLSGEAMILDLQTLTGTMPTAMSDFRFRCMGSGGTIEVSCSRVDGVSPIVSHAITCPPEPTGQTCGVVTFIARSDLAPNNFQGQVAVTLLSPPNPPSGADELAAAFAADPIPVGTCGNTPAIPTVYSVDLGSSVRIYKIYDGSVTDLLSLSQGSGTLYSGSGGTGAPPFGEALFVGVYSPLGPVSAGTFPQELVVTSPAQGSPAVITGGQPFTITWTPAQTLTSVVVSFGADKKTCRFDPATGTGTVPGAITSALTNGTDFTILGVRRRRTATKEATGYQHDCVLQTALATGGGWTIDKP